LQVPEPGVQFALLQVAWVLNVKLNAMSSVPIAAATSEMIFLTFPTSGLEDQGCLLRY